MYSIDSDRVTNDEWYKCQIGTGTAGNCGPTSVAMAIDWSGAKEVTARQVREYIGMPFPDGSTGFAHLVKALKYYKAVYREVFVKNIEDIDKILNDGNVIIILYYTGTTELSDGSRFGRNYYELAGHWIVLKDEYRGYWVANDPMPNGENRFYGKEQIWVSLNRKVIVVSKKYR